MLAFTTPDEPFVTILTPVYNGELYLEDCIKSVLAQKYENWEYKIINNCSTDGTLKIASRYAEEDPRIRVISNKRFVNCEENHNIAFRQIAVHSKYCKVVSADDWLTPECVSKMVKLAEAHPRVGVVGSYQMSGEKIKWKGLSHDVEVISGREVCRLSFLQKLDVFGNPSSVLYRSELIRKYNPFFPHSLPHADTSACYRCLEDQDFGFVHEVLSMERVHVHQESSRVIRVNMGDVAFFDDLLTYGRIYLNEKEFDKLKKDSFEMYYKWLGGCILKVKDKEFWEYHASRMRELGYPIEWRKVIKGIVEEIGDELQNPKAAFEKLLIVLKGKYCNLFKKINKFGA